MGYGLVPMLGGVFELVARTGIVVLIAGRTSFAGVCMADPTAMDCSIDTTGSILFSCDEEIQKQRQDTGSRGLNGIKKAFGKMINRSDPECFLLYIT